MPALITLSIHPSQFPWQVHEDLRKSLVLREVNHKFLYDSHKQTQKWLELHQVLSPSRTDPDCAACYDAAFAAVAERVRAPAIHLIGLGCGGGQKDARLLGLLQEKVPQRFYTPVDVSTAMVLTAHQVASSLASESHPFVCDLSSADDLAPFLARQAPAETLKVITFFGMIPNFEPQLVLPKIAEMLWAKDLLLLSANLAPGADYAAGVRQILPLYDNAPTNDWLLTFLLDLGVEKSDGALEWTIEACPSGSDLLRVEGCFRFEHSRSLRIAQEEFKFWPGEKIRLFFSYRYTPERILKHLSGHGLRVHQQWISDSGEEGVFLCGRTG